MKFFCCLIFASLIANKAILAHQHHGAKVPPGVPPQHYQPIEQNQQYQYQQQQQQQYEQQKQQNQQIHQQQQYAQPQQPIGHGHGHGPQPVINSGYSNTHMRPQDQVFDTSNIEMEREHLQEHMDIPIDTSQMSQDELMFHNFKMWDLDHDNVVDGLELMKYLYQHWGEDVATHYDDDKFGGIVDQILNRMDLNKDGITTFSEYRQSTQG